MIYCGYVWFSIGFAMFLVNFNRRPSPDLLLSYDFPWFCMVFRRFALLLVDLNRRPSPDPRLSCDFLYLFVQCSYGLAMLWVDMNRRPSPDLRLSDDSQWFGMLFLWFCYILGRF